MTWHGNKIQDRLVKVADDVTLTSENLDNAKGAMKEAIIYARRCGVPLADILHAATREYESMDWGTSLRVMNRDEVREIAVWIEPDNSGDRRVLVKRIADDARRIVDLYAGHEQLMGMLTCLMWDACRAGVTDEEVIRLSGMPEGTAREHLALREPWDIIQKILLPYQEEEEQLGGNCEPATVARVRGLKIEVSSEQVGLARELEEAGFCVEDSKAFSFGMWTQVAGRGSSK